LTPSPEKNRIQSKVKSLTATKGDGTWQGKYVAPHIAAKQGRSSMRLETPKAASKIFRPMSEHTEQTWPIGLEQRRPARGPKSPKVNRQLVVGHEIVEFLTFPNVDKKAKVVFLPISCPNISVHLSIRTPTTKKAGSLLTSAFGLRTLSWTSLNPKRLRRQAARKGETPFSLVRLPEVGVIGLGS